MHQVFKHLKENWIKYGFETFAILFGILGAFALTDWSEERNIRKNDIQFLQSLKSEIVVDTTFLSQRRKSYMDVNDQISTSLLYFDSLTKLTSSEYLAQVEGQNSIIIKFGDSLKEIAMRYVFPKVDFQVPRHERFQVKFDFNEVKNDRLVRNAMSKSIRYRGAYIGWMTNQLQKAEEILSLIDAQLEDLD